MKDNKRNNRIFLLYNSIKKLKSCKKEKLIGVFSLETGKSRRTILEYINVLIENNKIKEINGTIEWIK